jgi:hypothetical protein
VPLGEIGTATFYAEDRAPLFIRYIRAHQKLLADAKAVESTAPEANASQANQVKAMV